MNSVHEPSPNGDSKISPSRKPVRETKPDARAPSRPSRHAQVRTGAPRRTHGRRIVVGSLAVSWQGPGRVAGPSGRIAASLPHAQRASACAPAPQRQHLLAPHARSLAQPAVRPLCSQRRVLAPPTAVSWLGNRPCRDTAACPATQPTVTIHLLYCDTMAYVIQACCNTLIPA